MTLENLFPRTDRAGPVMGRERSLFHRAMGEGVPVVLLHGYPQTHAMWHRIADALLHEFRVILFDLPGYGRSDVPPDAEEHAPYAKRAMAHEVVAAMERLGHDRFHVVGHDRGARVAYRLALDHPERVLSLAALDIVPTGTLWRTFSVARAMTFYHWLFLAQPAPLPERLIGHDPAGFLDMTMAGWTKAKDLSAFHPAALEDYRACFSEPARVHATCEDYRAGAGIDRRHDEATLTNGKRIAARTLVLWGASFGAAEGVGPLDAWAEWAPKLSGKAIDAGHFLAEENPEATLAELVPFLRQGS